MEKKGSRSVDYDDCVVFSDLVHVGGALGMMHAA